MLSVHALVILNILWHLPEEFGEPDHTLLKELCNTFAREYSNIRRW
jgi:hypothetical protein